jgi:F-type H+-transporting ATPase subunit b
VELDWSTFVLEIVNFLILVWLLKRFLYKPVLDAIGRRKAAIAKTLGDAEERHAAAQTLEEQYRNRLGDWEQEKAKLRAAMLEEVEAERTRRLGELQSALEQAREKNRAIEDSHMKEWQSKAEEEAIAQGAQFAARLVARAAGPELEAKLIELALQDLAHVSEEQLAALRNACQEAQFKAKVTSAFALDEAQRSAIMQALSGATCKDIETEFVQDEHLLAGLRASIGPWILRANLQDELEFFAEAARHAR